MQTKAFWSVSKWLVATLLQQRVTREKSCPSKHFGQESILKAKRNENRIK